MNIEKCKLFRSPITPKKRATVSSGLIVLLSLGLLGCHTPSNPTGHLPKVLLVGDSITGYYTPAVQRDLTNVADVTRLFRSNSHNFLTNLDAVISEQPDVLHINCGLWDMIIMTNTGKVTIPLDEYKSNLAQIFQRLQKETHAQLIWATTTPVNEQMQARPRRKINGGYGRVVRRESDIEMYDRASIEVAKSFGIKIDNLFKVMSKAGPDKYWMDGVHFLAPGSEILGRSVANSIRPELSKIRN